MTIYEIVVLFVYLQQWSIIGKVKEHRAFFDVSGTLLAAMSANIWLGSCAGKISYRTLRSGLEQGRQYMDNRSTAAICRYQYTAGHAVRTHARVVHIALTSLTAGRIVDVLGLRITVFTLAFVCLEYCSLSAVADLASQ